MADDYVCLFQLNVAGLDTQFAEALKREGFVLNGSDWSITSPDPRSEFRRVVESLGRPPAEARFIPRRGPHGEGEITYRNY